MNSGAGSGTFPRPACSSGSRRRASSGAVRPAGGRTAWYTNHVRGAVLLLGLLLILPGAGEAGPAPVRLIAFGDFGVGGETQQRFGSSVRRFEARNPADFLVTLGDNDYTESTTAFHRNWQASFGWTARAGVRVAGVLGNHDVRVEKGAYEFD